MIAIPNMEMPKDCWECQMFGTWEEVGKFSCFLGAKVKDIDIRPTDCPLIDIVRCGECKYWTGAAQTKYGRVRPMTICHRPMRMTSVPTEKGEQMRLIDADELTFNRLTDSICQGQAEDVVAEAPTIDAEPVRRGRWIPVKGYEGILYKCSACDGRWSHTTNKTPYCSQCGAKMEKE